MQCMHGVISNNLVGFKPQMNAVFNNKKSPPLQKGISYYVQV